MEYDFFEKTFSLTPEEVNVSGLPAIFASQEADERMVELDERMGLMQNMAQTYARSPLFADRAHARVIHERAARLDSLQQHIAHIAARESNLARETDAGLDALTHFLND